MKKRPRPIRKRPVARSRRPEVHDDEREANSSHWLARGVVLAVISALLGALVTNWGDVRATVTRWFQDEPSAEQRWAAEYLRVTAKASFWDRPPTTLPSAQRFLEHHMREYDPARAHPFSNVGSLAFVPNVTRSPQDFSSAPVIVLGRVLTDNVVRRAPDVAGREYREILVQLAPLGSVGDSVVYCRVNAPARLRLAPNELLFVRGVAIAAGAVSLARGGFSQGAYLACSAIARPRGRQGDRVVPPLPKRLPIATYARRTFLAADSPLAHGVLLRDDARRAARWWFRHRRDTDLRGSDRYVGTTLGGCERRSETTLSCEAEGNYRREAGGRLIYCRAILEFKAMRRQGGFVVRTTKDPVPFGCLPFSTLIVARTTDIAPGRRLVVVIHLEVRRRKSTHRTRGSRHIPTAASSSLSAVALPPGS